MGWSVGIRLHIARYQLHSIPESLEDGIVCVLVCLCVCGVWNAM